MVEAGDDSEASRRHVSAMTEESLSSASGGAEGVWGVFVRRNMPKQELVGSMLLRLGAFQWLEQHQSRKSAEIDVEGPDSRQNFNACTFDYKVKDLSKSSLTFRSSWDSVRFAGKRDTDGGEKGGPSYITKSTD